MSVDMQKWLGFGEGNRVEPQRIRCSNDSAIQLLIAFAAVGSVVFNSAGFGMRWLELCGACTCITTLGLIGLKRHSSYQVVLSILGYAVLFIAPPILHLHVFWFVLFWSGPCLSFLAVATLFQWLLGDIAFGFPLVGGIGFATVALLLWARAILVPTNAVLTLLLILPVLDFYTLKTIRNHIEAENYSQVDYQYRVGNTIAKLLPHDEQSSGANRILRSSIHGTATADTTPGILLLDHDQNKVRPLVSEKANFAQPTPWQFNSFLGDQYVLFWMRCDGFFASSLGGTLKKGGRIMLQTATPGNMQILLAQRGSVLVFGDSDPFVNRIAPYQTRLLGFFLTANGSAYLPIIFGAFACISVVCSRYGKFALVTLLICGIIIVASICTNDRTYGGVRMVGKISDPHDPSLFSGVLRSIVDQGQDDLFSQPVPRILYVQGGYSARVGAERLVVAEPGAIVYLGKARFEILDIPLGVARNISDARSIRSKTQQADGTTSSGSVTIIGTGSPAQISPKEWLSH